MIIDLNALFFAQPLLLFFVVLASGYALSKLSVGHFNLSPPVGVLLTGMLFGHLGFDSPPMVQEIGFALFIYSVGLAAGPRFFNVFLADGTRYLSLSMVVAALAGATAFAVTRFFGFSDGTAAGILAGTMTSSPTLAAAQDAIRASVDQPGAALSRMGSAYAITYLVGLFSVLGLMRFAPRVMGVNLAEEALNLSKQSKYREEPLAFSQKSAPPPQLRAFSITQPDIVGRVLGEIDICRSGLCAIQGIKRDGEILSPTAMTQLHAGDIVSVTAEVDRLSMLSKRLGHEVLDSDLLNDSIDSVEIIVSQPDAVGKTLDDLAILPKFGCYITSLYRAHIPITPQPEIMLEKGDVLTVTGLKRRLDEVVKELGFVERHIVETDLITFVVGITLGLALGGFKLKAGDLTVGLGTAGGLLVIGLVFGLARSLIPTFGRVPPAARWVLSELGLMFFMASAGLKAGVGVEVAVRQMGVGLVVSGVAIAAVSLFGGLLFGRFALKLNPALLFGAMTGAMTSTPALKLVTQAAGSNLPSLGYAGTYAFANVFLAFTGALLARLL